MITSGCDSCPLISSCFEGQGCKRQPSNADNIRGMSDAELRDAIFTALTLWFSTYTPNRELSKQMKTAIWDYLRTPAEGGEG